MKILFLGCLFKQCDEKEILHKSKIGLQNQINAFQWALINGLEHELKNNIDIVNVLPVGTYPKYYSRIFLKTKKWKHQKNANDLEIGSINLPIIKQITRIISCRIKIKKWIKENECDDKVVIIYSTYLPFLYSIKGLSSNIKSIIIVTDLPEFYDLTQSENILYKTIRSIYSKLTYNLLNNIDAFVVLTKYMLNRLPIADKPYVVIEGIVDSNIELENNMFKEKNKIILYTGTLNFKFGIKNLLDAFDFIKNEQFELWICGRGEAEEEIKNRAKVDRRIKYLGYLTKNEIFQLQRKAKLLVNPRTNDGEYTKYSFPSKTMEYMISGTPVLMYKLAGIPDEYDKYLYYISGNKTSDIADSIINVCSKSQYELDCFAQNAREFVLKNKNNIMQAKKILDITKFFY